MKWDACKAFFKYRVAQNVGYNFERPWHLTATSDFNKILTHYSPKSNLETLKISERYHNQCSSRAFICKRVPFFEGKSVIE